MTDLLSALFSKWAFRKLQRAGYLIKTLYVAKSEALTPESATHQAVCGWASRCRKSQWCCKMLRQKASICSRSCRGSYMSSTHILFWFFFFSYSNQLQNSASAWDFQLKLYWEILSASHKPESCWVTCERKPHRGCWTWAVQDAQCSARLSQGVSFLVHSKQWVGKALLALRKPREGGNMDFFCRLVASSGLCVFSPESCHQVGSLRRCSRWWIWHQRLLTFYLQNDIISLAH